jgi:hypothetical protein
MKNIVRVDDIDLAEGNADDFFCTENGDIETGYAMMGWDELDEIETKFKNPVWFCDLG